MIQWREQPVEPGTRPIATLYETLALPDALRIAGALNDDTTERPLVIFDQSVRQRVYGHLRQSESELGGLLVGDAFATFHGSADHVDVVRILDCVAGEDFESTAVSLQLGTSVWTQARERLDAGRLIVGWYHSHPHIGAFFSETDRRTQRGFFAHPYSIGWVIDPFATDARLAERCFVGRDARELPAASIAARA